MSLSSNITLTSSFLSCTPIPTATVTEIFTTTYLVELLAACPTSAWPATYTVVEVCTAVKDQWTPPAVPSNFVETIVTCNICATPTQTITCPNAVAPSGGPSVIGGNGITANVTPPPTNTPVAPTKTGAPAVPSKYVTAGAPGFELAKEVLFAMGGAIIFAGYGAIV